MPKRTGVLTSIPSDTEQIFYANALRVFNALNSESYAIFWQGTQPYDGFAFDAPGLLGMAALATEHRLIWHRVVVAAETIEVRIGHLVCYGKRRAVGTPPQPASPREAFRFACAFLKAQGVTDVVDPFGRCELLLIEAVVVTHLTARVLKGTP